MTPAVPSWGSSSTPDQRYFTLNVGGPSEARAARLADFLTEVSADVVVLTETRTNRGTQLLLEWCKASGYSVSAQEPMSAGERGVVIAYRLPAGAPVAVGPIGLPHRLAAVELLLEPRLTVVGAYVPSRDGSAPKIARKRSFLLEMQACVSTWMKGRSLMLLGDLNVVARDHQPRYSAFRAWEYETLDNLQGAGLVDLFAELHPGVQAHSWIGRTGDGYRYDYALLSPCLAERAISCEYVHEPRELGLSDHAGLLVHLRARAAAVSQEGPHRHRGALELV